MNPQTSPTEQDTERYYAALACCGSPLLGVACWFLSARYLLFVLFLQPIRTGNDFWQQLTWKPALACGFCGLVIPWIWKFSLLASSRINVVISRKIPVAALLAIAWVGMSSTLMTLPKARHFLVEWAKVRTPNPSFARNTLFWEVRAFEAAASGDKAAGRVGLVGSSQMYQGTDLDVLSANAPTIEFEKNCLAGFGPMQYLWLQDRILERRFDVVVCWLSEFDFYREDTLPVSRLRWASTPGGCITLIEGIHRPIVNWSQRTNPIARCEGWNSHVDDHWEMRGDYADLGLGAVLPIWRNRDHIRRTVLGYWWNVSEPSPDSSPVQPELAQSAGMTAAMTNLEENVGEKRLVDTNFAAFEQFAKNLQRKQIRLIVCEGCSHPQVMKVYDQSLRARTRQQLARLSTTAGFTFLDASRLPAFAESDFSDPYHLGPAARVRFSKWLAGYVRSELPSSVAAKSDSTRPDLQHSRN